MAGGSAAARAARVCSFTEGTVVWMCDGSLKAIEQVQEGELVWAQDPETGAVACRKVVDPYENPDRAIIELEFYDEASGTSEVIETTNNHPFYVTGKGFTRVDELQLGDQIPGASGLALSVQRIYLTGRLQRVYNFGVSDFHTYFVGEVGAWVHNCAFSEILRPGGKIIGKPGSKSTIRELDGGIDAAKELFEKLSKNGTPYTKPYDGTAFSLPDGGFIGFRTYSTRSGPNIAATIDINIPNFPDVSKLKFRR